MKKAFILLISIFCVINVYALDDIEAGKNIFKSNCTSCHKIESKFVGPALKNVDQRHSIDWIVNFVHSSQTLIKQGDTSAVRLFNENNQTLMPDNPGLSDADIKNIIAYIKDESSKAPAQTAPFAKPVEMQGNSRPYAPNNYWLFIGLGAFIIFMIYVFNMIIKSVDLAKACKAQNQSTKECNCTCQSPCHKQSTQVQQGFS